MEICFSAPFLQLFFFIALTVMTFASSTSVRSLQSEKLLRKEILAHLKNHQNLDELACMKAYVQGTMEMAAQILEPWFTAYESDAGAVTDGAATTQGRKGAEAPALPYATSSVPFLLQFSKNYHALQMIS